MSTPAEVLTVSITERIVNGDGTTAMGQCALHTTETQKPPQNHRGARAPSLCGSVDFCDAVVWSGEIDPLPEQRDLASDPPLAGPSNDRRAQRDIVNRKPC